MDVDAMMRIYDELNDAVALLTRQAQSMEEGSADKKMTLEIIAVTRAAIEKLVPSDGNEEEGGEEGVRSFLPCYFINMSRRGFEKIFFHFRRTNRPRPIGCACVWKP